MPTSRQQKLSAKRDCIIFTVVTVVIRINHFTFNTQDFFHKFVIAVSIKSDNSISNLMLIALNIAQNWCEVEGLTANPSKRVCPIYHER